MEWISLASQVDCTVFRTLPHLHDLACHGVAEVVDSSMQYCTLYMQTQSDTCIRYNYIFKGLRLTAGRRQRNGRTRSLVVRMMRTVGPAWGNVGLSWRLCGPILRPTSADLEAYVWAHVDPCWAKRSETWEQQENTVKRRIFWWSAAYLGAMLTHLGAMLAHLEGNVGPSWGYVGPSWAYVGPSWAYVGAIWGRCWGYVGATWGYVGRSCAMFVQKHVEWHRAKKHCKLQGDLSTRTPYCEVGGTYITFGYHRRPSGQHTGVQAGARI